MTHAITEAGPAHDDSRERLARLEDIAGQLLQRCRDAGASQAEVSCSEDRGLNVNVRMGEVESVESTRDRGIAVTVYFGKRRGSASTADLREESLAATVEQACAIARHTEDDAAAGLADAGLMAREASEFDTWHPWALDAQEAVELALAAEQAGRDADARITNSDGAGVGSGNSLGVYANSHGFVGAERGSHHSVSCALIAGRGDEMQREGWYSYALAAGDLEPAASIGRRAARRTVERRIVDPSSSIGSSARNCSLASPSSPVHNAVRASPRRMSGSLAVPVSRCWCC